MWYACLAILIILADQLTKAYVAAASGFAGATNGAKINVYTLIDGFLDVDYCENNNGMMSLFDWLPNKDLIFIVATVVILLAIFIYLALSKNRGKWLNFSLALVIAGALGNFIDRIFLEYVRDMIHVIIDFGRGEIFPYIFNVADMALVVGAIMLILDILFIDDDALFMSKKRRAKVADKKKTLNAKEDFFSQDAD